MVSTTLTTDTWIKVSWSEFLELAEEQTYPLASFYYDQGRIRIEMSPIGWNHGNYNNITGFVINLFASLKKLPIKGLINCSFRQAGFAEFQPDLAFYIGEGLKIPNATNSPVDLNEYSLPNLVVEIAATSLGDDLGQKRLLYERLGIAEYWVIDVQRQQAIAFSISQGRSGQISQSTVLPGLEMTIVEEALKRSNTEDDGKINRWLIETFSSI